MKRKKINIFLIILVILSGCNYDTSSDLECPIYIHGIDFYGAENNSLPNEIIYNWDKTQYLNHEINFVIELDVSGDPAYCEKMDSWKILQLTRQ
jgi:hypothetical protein